MPRASANSSAANFKATDLSEVIGTVLIADRETLLSGEIAQNIRDLLDKRGVIVFPEIGLSDEQQIAFTRTLGVYAPEPNTSDGIFKVTMDPATPEYLKASFYWHIDGTRNDMPIRASIMSARGLAPSGGQTEFSNTYAAYDALSAAAKESVDCRKVIHSFEAIARHINPEPSYAELKSWHSHSRKMLPLVWTHQSGRKSLILGNTAHYVVGLDHEESFELLTRLRDHATQRQFVYQHEWKLGDMVLWDNTGTMHRAMSYPFDSGRVMHRTKLEGEEAFA